MLHYKCFKKTYFTLHPIVRVFEAKAFVRERERVFMWKRGRVSTREQEHVFVWERELIFAWKRKLAFAWRREHVFTKEREKECVCVCVRMREKVKGRERTSPWYVIPLILALLVGRSVTTQVCFNNNNITSNNTTSSNTSNVTTLALGSWLRQRFTRAWAKRSVKECEHEVTRSQVPS